MMESGKDYGVRVIRAFGQFSVGKVIYPPGGQRDDMVRRGMVEVVKDQPTADEPRKKLTVRREQ